MEGAGGRDELDWEALYLRLSLQNATWNSTEWYPGWNASAVPNTTWWEASAPFDSPAALVRAAAKAVVLGLLILATVIGKILRLYVIIIIS